MASVASFISNARAGYSTIRNGATAAYGTLGSTASGRAFKQGVAEAFGWGIESETVTGLGKVQTSYGFGSWRALTGKGATVFGGTKTATESMFASQFTKESADGLRTLGLTKRFMKAGAGMFGAATMAWSMYNGWKEGGISGAAKEGAINAGFWGMMRVANVALSSVGAGILGAGIAAGVGGYYAGEAAHKYAKGLRNIEMGTPLIDPFGTASTLRQRSLNAIQNSHIAGRSAIGNEAMCLAGRGIFGR